MFNVINSNNDTKITEHYRKASCFLMQHLKKNMLKTVQNVSIAKARMKEKQSCGLLWLLEGAAHKLLLK